jgi:hypothetical protein
LLDERCTTIIEDDLQSVESWIAYLDREALEASTGPSAASPEPAPGQPSAPGTPAPNPAAPTSGPAAPSGAAPARR